MSYHYDDLPKDDIEFDVGLKPSRAKSLLNATADLDDDFDTGTCVLASDLLANAEKKKAERKRSAKLAEEAEKEEYMAEMRSLSGEDADLNFAFESAKKKKKKKKKNKKKFNDIFGFNDDDEDSEGKKKKKDGQPINHKKEFDAELTLLRSMQVEQSKFVDSLQKKYDQLENSKSSARSIGKLTTDLINSITTARSTNLQIINAMISTKKSIADMNFKERKEFGSSNSSENASIVNYASTYLKTMMDAGRSNIANPSDNNSQGYDSVDDDDDLFDGINDSLGDENRSDETLSYLKYENRGVKVNVIWHDDLSDDDPNKYEFQAVDKDGVVLDDYPLPDHTRMSINRSTSIATDLYGNKYRLIVV